MKRFRRHQAAATLLCIIALGATADSASAQIIVSKSGGGSFSTIQAAINAAQPGQTIIVQPATYIEKINYLGKGLHIRSANPLDPEIVEETIIQGVGTGSCVTFANGEPESAILEGFTIRAGDAGLNGTGGGILCSQGSRPIIRRNVIAENTSQLHGGAIACLTGSAPTVADNEIAANSCEGRGGGIYVDGASPRIVGNFIRNNFTQDSSGGGVYIGAGADGAALIGNTISQNTAVFGGGVSVDYSAPLLLGNRLYGNHGAPRGGGIALFESDALIVSNVIAGNQADISAAIDANSSKPVIAFNTILSNRPFTAAGILSYNTSDLLLTGNIIAYHDTGIAVQTLPGAKAALEHNCLFMNATDYSNSVTLKTGNLFVDPLLVSIGEFVEGGGGSPPSPDGEIDYEGPLVGEPPIAGTVEYKLKPDRERFQVEASGFPPSTLQKVYLNGAQVGQFFVNSAGNGNLDYDSDDGNFPAHFPEVNECDEVDVGGLAIGYLGLELGASNCGGVTWLAGDETLTANSPCIGAGGDGQPVIAALNQRGESFRDLEQQLRPYAALADIGADEVLPHGSGDFNGDGDVDLADYADFVDCFGATEPTCIIGDYVGAPLVNQADTPPFVASLTGPL